MEPSILLHQSTKKLEDLLKHSTTEDLALLIEYNFGPGAGPKTSEELLAQIRYNGSNDIARMVRGGAVVDYLTIVRDVAKKMDVEWSREESAEEIEKRIFINIFERAWKAMSDQEREPIKKFFEDHGADAQNISKLLIEGTLFDFLPTVGYLVTWNIARIVALASAREVGAGALTGFFSEGIGALFIGPIGLVLGVALTAAFDIAGPAYRKTIPTVLQIAYLRQKSEAAKKAT
ncbi:MAG: hypothetical protein H6Q66_2470 [Firmicutes bacterium]|nr:hypothetical protein [Bacillota bacterium]